MFRESKQVRIFQDVVEQIQEAIIEGKLQSGDHLPCERELKEQFNISRGTLRESLRILEQKGLIEIRTGVLGGAIVKEISIDQISESLSLLIRYKKVSPGTLAEFREGVDGTVASLATERVNARDIEHLRKLLSEAQTHLEGGISDWDAFMKTDIQFHLALAQITGNLLFMSVLKTIYDNIKTYYDSYLPKNEEILQQNLKDLTDIVQAIEMRNPQKAGELAREHVRRFNEYMEKMRSTSQLTV